MMLRRLTPSAACASMYSLWSSGPRWRKAAAIRSTTARESPPKPVVTNPVMPHISHSASRAPEGRVVCSRQAPVASGETERSIPPATMRAELAASCESAGAGREADGRSARRGYRTKRRRGGVRFARLDVGNGRPSWPGIDGVRNGHRARAGDEGNHVVEIVVIPIAADPCRIGGIRVGKRRQPEDEGDE